jgi:phage terminase Nu1 subunit (DNA packaging protein)
VLRAVRPDIARMIEAGIVMDTVEMTFDPTTVRRRFPQLAPRTADEVVDRLFAGSFA